MHRTFIVLSRPTPCPSQPLIHRIAIKEGRRVVVDQFIGGYQTYEQADTVAAAFNADPEMQKQSRNLRFWDYLGGGLVKITLRPAQLLRHHRSARTDEGWTSEGVSYLHDGARIRRDYGTDGRDCDGRLQTSGRDYCPVDQLAVRPRSPCSAPPILLPQWQEEETRQRDFAAEEAGY